MRRIYYDTRTRFLNLGRQMGKVPAQLPIRKWGNINVQGKPRVGKSGMSKLIVANVGQYRQCVIFDCNGEWVNQIIYYNWNSPYPKKLVNYKIVRNFAFYISEFSSVQDWISLGFTGTGANIMLKASQSKEFHNDAPEKLRELIVDLPESGKELGEFNSKYKMFGITLDHAVFTSTKVSMLMTLDNIELWFYRGRKDFRKRYDFKILLDHYDHLIFDMTFKGGSDPNYQRAMCGKILSIFADPDFLMKHKPFMVFEESANLFPDFSKSKEMETPSSVILGREFAWKFPKYDVSCMLIFQMESQIDDRILEHNHLKVLFRGANGKGREFRLADDLMWDPEKNRRSAVMIRENGTYAFFEPHMTPCKAW